MKGKVKDNLRLELIVQQKGEQYHARIGSEVRDWK